MYLYAYRQYHTVAHGDETIFFGFIQCCWSENFSIELNDDGARIYFYSVYVTHVFAFEIVSIFIPNRYAHS